MITNPMERPSGADAQHGFTTLEITLVAAMLSTFVFATAATLGMRPPRTHAAAIALEAALVEARSLATATGDLTDRALPTGATVYVAPDPVLPGHSVVTVYRSRPISYGNPGGRGEPLQADLGFPPERVAAVLTAQNGPEPAAGQFAILVSASGYASVAAPLGWDPGKSGAVLAEDPGCLVGDVTIAAYDGSRRESHALACRDASYDASR